MTELGQSQHVLAVRFERVLPAAPDAVWACLTQVDKLPGWYGAGATIEAREGGLIRLSDGHIRGRVTQVRPLAKLAYSWNVFGPGEEVSPFPESYLTLELAPHGAATALTLTHLPILARFEKQNAMGWHTFLDMLRDAVAHAPVAAREVYMQRNAALYGVDLQNLQR